MSINITPLTTDLNAHQNLPAQPSLTSSELKVAWDKPVNDIKTYLNNMTQGTEDSTLKHEIEEAITEGVNTAKSYTDTQIAGISQDAADITYDNTTSGMTATNVKAALDELKSGANTLSNSVSSLTTALNGKIVKQEWSGTFANMGDWEYTANLTPSIPSGYKFLAANWDSFGDTDGDEPRALVYMPHKNQIRVHIGSAQVGHTRNHTYKIIAYYIKIS